MDVDKEADKDGVVWVDVPSVVVRNETPDSVLPIDDSIVVLNVDGSLVDLSLVAHNVDVSPVDLSLVVLNVDVSLVDFSIALLDGVVLPVLVSTVVLSVEYSPVDIGIVVDRPGVPADVAILVVTADADVLSVFVGKMEVLTVDVSVAVV